MTYSQDVQVAEFVVQTEPACAISDGEERRANSWTVRLDAAGMECASQI